MRTLSLVGLASALLMLCACNPPSAPTVAAVTQGETQPSAPPRPSPLVTLNPKKVVTFLLHPTPPEIWKLYRESEHNPAVLFAYIDPSFEFNVKRDPEGAVDPADEGRRALLRWYATVRLGDIGGAEVIPVLEEAARRYEARDETGIASHLRVTVERIRYRLQGREAYVRAMIGWLEAPEPPDDAPFAQRVEMWRKVREAARALAAIRAKEAVPALIKWASIPAAGGFADLDIFCARALAWIGDRRALGALKFVLANWPVGYNLKVQRLPLEPGEPDLLWAYWVMRTEGMTAEEAADEMIRTLSTAEGAHVRSDMMLGHLPREVMVPRLLKALVDPPAGGRRSVAQAIAARWLANFQAREAVPSLRALLRDAQAEEFLRGQCAISLAQMHATEALEDIVAQVQQDSLYYLKIHSIRALGTMGDARAQPVLLDCLRHAHPSVRYEAAEALTQMGTASALPALRERLSAEKNVNVRGRINWAIGEIERRAKRGR